MKSMLVVAAVILFCNVSFGRDEKEPSDLVTLRAAYEVAVKKATESLTKTYLQNLDKLKKKYGAAGDIKSAALVQDEIDQLDDSSEGVSLAKLLPSTTWTWHGDNSRGETIHFEKATVSKGGETWEWKVMGPRKIVLVRSDNRKAELLFDSGKKSFKGTDFDGHGKLMGELVK